LIGWRPYLLTLLAAGVLVGVGLNVVNERRPKSSPPCAIADGLKAGGFLAAADKAYATVLRSDKDSTCARSGLADVEKRQCERATSIAAVDSTMARKRLLALAAADPRPPKDSCIWAILAVSAK
jgi:hypothetical protein